MPFFFCVDRNVEFVISITYFYLFFIIYYYYQFPKYKYKLENFLWLFLRGTTSYLLKLVFYNKHSLTLRFNSQKGSKVQMYVES